MCIKFGSSVTADENVYIDGCLIQWVDQVKHLGNTVNSKLTDNDDCYSKRCVFNGSVNKLIGNYGRLQSDILCTLFRSYCCSFYGSQLWDLTSNGFKSCCTQWNKAVRKLMNLPYRCHTSLLGPLVDQLHISVQLCIKSLRFFFCMLNSNNQLVSHMCNLAIHCANSPVGRNISFLKYKYGVNISDNLSVNVVRVKNAHLTTMPEMNNVFAVKELLNIKHGLYTVDGFNSDMIESILYSIACE